MADSENSRTVPEFTRRKIRCARPAVAEAPDDRFLPDVFSTPTPLDDTDAALWLWMQWQDRQAHRRKLSARRRAAELAPADLDDATGYGGILRAESKAAAEESSLAETLLSTPTRSVAGAAAKLSCFIETNTRARHDRKPVGVQNAGIPALRAILTDLVMIGGINSGFFRE